MLPIGPNQGDATQCDLHKDNYNDLIPKIEKREDNKPNP